MFEKQKTLYFVRWLSFLPNPDCSKMTVYRLFPLFLAAKTCCLFKIFYHFSTTFQTVFSSEIMILIGNKSTLLVVFYHSFFVCVRFDVFVRLIKQPCNLFSRLNFTAVIEMAVIIRCCSVVRMTEPFLNTFHRHTICNQKAGT